MTSVFSKKKGFPFPLGTDFVENGINFAVYAKPAETVHLQIWSDDSLRHEIEMYRTGDIWHVWVPAEESLIYTYSVVNQGVASVPLVDPYARKLDVPKQWNSFDHYRPRSVATPRSTSPHFLHPKIPREKLIVYEMHIRGFTQDPTSGVKHPGTFLGVIEKIPHLQNLGVNAVKILPIFEFNECEVVRHNPQTGERLLNYWGYSPVHFFCPMQRYAVNDPIHEFQEMVRALHDAGIEVILDVVYNHTAEGNEEGPTYHFKALGKDSYYIMKDQSQFYNFSGCGNSINANHPVTYQLILDSLRYWVLEMGVDGFRFDLAALMTRDAHGRPLSHPPLIYAIAQDPWLSGTKLFAEAWDASGLYRLGEFSAWDHSWSEWNGKYRDHVREFIKGNPGLKGDFATRICGSSDLYPNGSPNNSLNFVTAHDGFTLCDLVSYNQKHNLANGEDNRDGSSFNDSWNCGHEGPTDDSLIQALRERQIKNFVVALFVSAGIPMITSGDEYAQTKMGNNNTWCQDNVLNWLDWDAINESPFIDFFKKMIDIRKRFFEKSTFYQSSEIIWHGTKLFTPNWDKSDSFIAFQIPEKAIYCYFNATGSSIPFEMPSGNWIPLIETSDNGTNEYSSGLFTTST